MEEGGEGGGANAKRAPAARRKFSSDAMIQLACQSPRHGRTQESPASPDLPSGPVYNVFGRILCRLVPLGMKWACSCRKNGGLSHSKLKKTAGAPCCWFCWEDKFCLGIQVRREDKLPDCIKLHVFFLLYPQSEELWKLQRALSFTSKPSSPRWHSQSSVSPNNSSHRSR